jgi:hypothetical protein
MGKTRDLLISPSPPPWIVSRRRRASVTSWTAVATSGTAHQPGSPNQFRRKGTGTDLLDRDH